MIKRVALCLLLVAGVAAAEGDAERYYREGQDAYDAKRYDEAITAWSRSYEISHLPALVFNLAQAHRLKGECTEAVASYKKFIELDPKSPQRVAADGFLKDLEPCPSAKQPEPPTQPEPPPHVDQPPVTPPVVQHPPVTPPVVGEAHHSRGELLAGIAIGAAGVVALGVGAYYGSQAQSLADDVKQACASGCDYDTIKQKDQDGRSDQTLQYVMYGVGAAAIAGGAILYVVGSRHHTESPVAVVPTRGGAAASWILRF